MKRTETIGGLLFIAGVTALVVWVCPLTSPMTDSLVARCPFDAPTIVSKIGKGMGEGRVRYLVGAPQVIHRMHESYCATYRWRFSLTPPALYRNQEPCDQMTRLIYWNGDPTGRAVEVMLNWNAVVSVNERTYPLWLVNKARAQSAVGKNSSDVRQWFGEPEIPNDWGQFRGTAPGGPVLSYREGRAYMSVYCDAHGRVLGVDTGIIQPM